MRRTVFALLAAVALLVVAVAAAIAAPGDLVSAYLRAAQTGAVGEIEMHAYAESKRPSGAPVPYAGVAVALLPYADDLDQRLDAVKTRYRDSLERYGKAHEEVRTARMDQERQLAAAGAAHLARMESTDASGAVRLTGVPAGEWLVLGWREEPHEVKGRTPARDAGMFSGMTVPTGYAAISYWKARVTVRAGETAEVKFSDRSVWLTAIRQEVAPVQTKPPARHH
jgi:hypothetical protein